MADETLLGGVVGVDVSAGEAEGLVPSVGGGRVLRAAAELGLGVLAGGDGVVGGTADVAELIANAVEDDVGVQRLLLPLVDNRVNSLVNHSLDSNNPDNNPPDSNLGSNNSKVDKAALNNLVLNKALHEPWPVNPSLFNRVRLTPSPSSSPIS